MDANNETLKKQFKSLQEQQYKKLALQKKRQSDKEKAAKEAKSGTPPLTFGVDDSLDLKLSYSSPVKRDVAPVRVTENTEKYEEEIRELKDENGRLYKLLSEKEFEIKQLKKKSKEQPKTGIEGVISENAASKIVELSKRVRELTTELESEKTRSKEWAKKCQKYVQEISAIKQDDIYLNGPSNSGSSKPESNPSEVKSLEDKLRAAEMKMSDYRNQCQTYKKDLQVAQKVLASEVGEGISFQSLLNASSGWRGRSQQVILLQKKVEELKSKLEETNKGRMSASDDVEMMHNYRTGATTISMASTVKNKAHALEEKYKAELKVMEKERRESHEQTLVEMKILKQDHSDLKQKLDASKARNKVLSNEIKQLKQQMQKLIDKGKHDDELVQALMMQQDRLKHMLDSANKEKSQRETTQSAKVAQLSMKTQQESNIVEQLKSIVDEKEHHVRALEEEIKQLRINKDQRSSSAIGEPRIDKGQQRSSSAIGESRINKGQQQRSASAIAALFDVSQNPSAVNNLQDGTVLHHTPSPQPAQSTTPIDNQYLEELKLQFEEQQAVAKVAEVERNRLMEFVEVLQRRLNEANDRVTDVQSDLLQYKRKNVELEKQIDKKRLTTATRGSSSRPVLNNDDVTNNATLEELEMSLSIQKDENEALKMALKSTLQAKEEDLKIYSQVMDETKLLFIQKLKECKLQNST